MMKKIPHTICLLLFSLTTYSQVNVTISNMTYVNGTPISNCGTVDFGTNSTVRVQFTIDLSKQSNQVVGNSNLYVYSIGSSGTRIERMNHTVLSASFDTYYSSSADITMNASDFNTNGGTLFAIFKSSAGVEYQTACSYSITKTLIPTFALSPGNVSLPCGNTNSRTFTVTSSNIPNGATVTYSWSNNGWSVVGSTINSITLQPNSGTVLPSSVTVTPYINGVAQSTRTSTVSRAPFSSPLTISGPSIMCNSVNYSVNTAGTTLQVTGWSVSNPSIANISGSGNSATLTATSSGVVDITATLQNTCGQTTTISKSGIIIGTGAPTATGFDVISNNTHYTPNGNYGTGFIICPTEYLSITPKPYRADVLEHQWTLTGNYQGTYNPSSAILSVTSSSQVGATFQYSYRARSACGWGPWITGTFTNMDCDGGEEPWFFYPNPTSETLTIEPLNSKKEPMMQIPVYIYTLYDFNGIIVQQGTFTGKTILDVSKLKKGRYILKTKNDESKEDTHHIIIN